MHPDPIHPTKTEEENNSPGQSPQGLLGGLKAQITQLKQVAISGQVSAANPFQNALGVPI